MPVVDVIKRHSTTDGPLMDGFCYFGVQASCTTSHRSRDYKLYAVGSIGAGLALDAYYGMRDVYVDPSGFRTMPGVSLEDAKWCHDIGALNISQPERLLRDSDALEKKAQEMCDAFDEPIEEMTMAELKQRWDENRELLNNYYKDPPDARPAAFDRVTKSNRWVGGWNCAMGTLACELALCIYHYCWLEGGVIGQGAQCRENYMK